MTPIYPAVPTPDRDYTSARREGFEAFHKDLSRCDCPYKTHGRRRTDWLSGWYRANEGKPFVGLGQDGSKGQDPKASMRSHTKAMFRGMKEAA